MFIFCFLWNFYKFWDFLIIKFDYILFQSTTFLVQFWKFKILKRSKIRPSRGPLAQGICWFRNCCWNRWWSACLNMDKPTTSLIGCIFFLLAIIASSCYFNNYGGLHVASLNISTPTLVQVYIYITTQNNTPPCIFFCKW